MHRLLLLAPSLAAAAMAQELRFVAPLVEIQGCYDSRFQRVVCPGQGNYSLEWDGANWHRSADLGSPYGFCYQDLVTGQLRVMAEREPYGTTPPAYDTWQRRHGAWQNLTPATGPARRSRGGLAYDEARMEVVLFGGIDSFGQEQDDTWVFDGTTWIQRTPVHAPPSRFLPAMTYDATRQRVVMFGGSHNSVELGDTWEWDGTDWLQAGPIPSPLPRLGASMAFDRARGVSMLSGGVSSVQPGPWGFLDLWEYDGATWVQRTSPPTFGARSGSLAYDPARGETLMLRTYNAMSTGKVLAWDGANWNLRQALPSNPPSAQGASATLDASGTAVLRFGGDLPGNPLATALFSYDAASSWQVLAPTGPPTRGGALMWSQAGATHLFSGADTQTGQVRADHWLWNGTAWSQLNLNPLPPPRYYSAVAGMPPHNLAVAYGGYAGLTYGDTWLFDGANWAQLTTGPQPPPRFHHAMAYDPLRDRVVLFGGSYLTATGTASRQDTWEFDGTAWQQVAFGASNVPPAIGVMAFDANRQRTVFAATSSQVYEFWEFDGVAWTPFPAVGDANSTAIVRAVQPVALTGPDGRFTAVDAFGTLALVPTPAAATAYGTACTTDAAQLTANWLPMLGDATFALEATLAPSNSLVVIVGGDVAVNVPVFGCQLLAAPVVTLLLSTDPVGYAPLPLPVPNVASLAGIELFFQALTLSAGAPAGLTLSRGLRVALGR